MPDQPMELGVAEGIIGEIPKERWEAYITADAEPTVEEIRAFRSLWDAYRQQRLPVRNMRTVFRRNPERSPR